MYRAALTTADERLLKARAVVRERDELIAARDRASAEHVRIALELAYLEKDIAERARGFLRLAYRPRQAEDITKHRALTEELQRLDEKLVQLAAQITGYRGAVKELAAARDAKHAQLIEAGAPISEDLAAIAAQLAREDADANELDDAIDAASRTELLLRRAATVLRAIDTRDRSLLPDGEQSARTLAREARAEATQLWDRLRALGVTVDDRWLGETFASLLAYIQVDGRIIEARATLARVLSELAEHAAKLHARAAQVAQRVAALVAERDHLLE